MKITKGGIAHHIKQTVLPALSVSKRAKSKVSSVLLLQVKTMDKKERCRSPGRGGHGNRGHHHSPGRGGHRGGHGHGGHHGHHSPGHHGHGSGSGSGSGSNSPSPPPGHGDHGHGDHGHGDHGHGDHGHGDHGHGDHGHGNHGHVPYFPPTLDIYRSWNGKNSDHFYTIDLTEHFNAVQHLGYANEGIVGRVLVDPGSIPPCPQNKLAPLYRLWNGKISDHFYTSNEDERQNAISQLGYHDEGKVGYCVLASANSHSTNPTNPPNPHHSTNPGGDPTHHTNPTDSQQEYCCDAKKALHRFYNEKSHDHFYTTCEEEVEKVKSTLHDYKYEGIQCYLW